MESLLAQLQELNHWQIDLLAIGLLLQGAILAVLPEEVIAISLGALCAQGRISYLEALISMQIGLLPANGLMVYLGQRFGDALLTKPPFSWLLQRQAVEGALIRVRQYGWWLVFATRFIPTIRGPVYAAVGMSRMGVLRFMKIDGLASCLHVPLLLFLGSTLGRSSSSVIEVYRRVGLLAAALLAFGVIAAFAHSATRLRRSS